MTVIHQSTPPEVLPVDRCKGSGQLAAVACAGLAIASTGCGGERTAPPAQREVAAKTVTIGDFKFKPEAITVPTGASVTWRNVDSAGHTATSDEGGKFDSGAIQRGRSKTLTLSRKGTIPYHCDFHPFMKGRVVVR